MIIKVKSKNGTRKLSRAEWLNQAPDFLSPEEAKLLRARAAAAINAEREQAIKRARELEAELTALGVGGDAHTDADEGDPAKDWSVLRLVKHYLRTHPGANAGPIIEFVVSVRPGEETSNVNSILYKYSKPGRALRKTGTRGSYVYYSREVDT